MNSQTRKIIVGGGLAVFVGIVAVIFTVSAHHDTLVAQAAPPTPFTEAPAASAALAQTPDTPPTLAQVPDAPTAIAHSENVGTQSADIAAPSAAEPKVARARHLKNADTSAAATTDTGTSPGSVAQTSEKPAAEAAR